MSEPSQGGRRPGPSATPRAGAVFVVTALGHLHGLARPLDRQRGLPRHRGVVPRRELGVAVVDHHRLLHRVRRAARRRRPHGRPARSQAGVRGRRRRVPARLVPVRHRPGRHDAHRRTRPPGHRRGVPGAGLGRPAHRRLPARAPHADRRPVGRHRRPRGGHRTVARGRHRVGRRLAVGVLREHPGRPVRADRRAPGADRVGQRRRAAARPTTSASSSCRCRWPRSCWRSRRARRGGGPTPASSAPWRWPWSAAPCSCTAPATTTTPSSTRRCSTAARSCSPTAPPSSTPPASSPCCSATSSSSPACGATRS